MDATLSPEEFQEWQVYYQLEPFGSPAEDNRARVNNAITWVTMGDKGKPIPDWALLDRDPEETARIKLEQQNAELLAFFERHVEAGTVFKRADDDVA